MAKASKSKTCSESGCGRATHARGLCQKHYDQSRARDTRPRGATAPEPARPAGRPRQATETTCSFPGCTAAHHARGYCKSHYSRARRRGKSRSTAGRASQCEIAGCSRLAVRNKRCAQHLKVVKDGPRHLTKVERLGEIRKRHELMRREIERIRQSFESEKDE